jgi:predicted dehydrogenase
MSDRKLGVALHGAGGVAVAHVASWLRHPRVEIVSVSSRSRQSAERLARRFDLACAVGDDYEAVLADPRVDVVDLCGPNHVHGPQAVAGAEAGKHVLIEKPMVLSMDENRRLRDAVAEAGVRSVVGFVLRWNPLLVTLRRLLDGGAIGELFYVEVDYWHGIGPWYSGWEWAHRRATGGSTSLLAGCHALDALRWLAGRGAVAEVCAYGNNKKGLYEYDANYVAVLRFEDGTIGKSSALMDAVMPYAFNIDLVATEGTLRDNRLYAPQMIAGQNDWARIPTVLPDSGDVAHHPYDALTEHLVECVVEGRESHCNVADCYHTHELCLAVDRSLEAGGRPVRLPL